MGFDVSDELIFFGRIEVPKRDNNCLVVVAAHFDGASCGLTVYGLDAVAFGSEPVVHFFFEVSKAFRFSRGEQLKLGRHGHSYMPWATIAKHRSSSGNLYQSGGPVSLQCVKKTEQSTRRRWCRTFDFCTK